MDFSYPSLPHFLQLHPHLSPSSENTEKKLPLAPPPPARRLPSLRVSQAAHQHGSCSAQGGTFLLLTELIPQPSFSIDAHFWVSRCLDSGLGKSQKRSKRLNSQLAWWNFKSWHSFSIHLLLSTLQSPQIAASGICSQFTVKKTG